MDDWVSRLKTIREAFPDKNFPLQLNPPTEGIKVPHLQVEGELWSLWGDFLEHFCEGRVTHFYPDGQFNTRSIF